MITQRLAADAPDAMQRAFETLEAGGVVAFPTDTVYGLGAPAFNAASIERLFAIKGRELTKAIAVLIAEPGELDKVAKGIHYALYAALILVPVSGMMQILTSDVYAALTAWDACPCTRGMKS